MESPRTRLRKKLGQKKSDRVRRTPPSIQTQLGKFPEWVTKQLVRDWHEVCHNGSPFMLLFRFNLKEMGVRETQLDVLLIKVNGGIYYESSTHPDGLQARLLGRDIKVTPAQLIYVYSPRDHTKDASVDIGSVNISELKYVGTPIPGAYVTSDRAWEAPLDVNVHLPVIRAPPSTSE